MPTLPVSEFQTVSEVARELGVRPRDVSDAFYARKLDDSQCPVIAGRRLIPAAYVETIRQVLCGQDEGAA